MDSIFGKKMQKKTYIYSILSVAMCPTFAIGAALDRSGQSISNFLQDGNYAEIGVSSLHPKVTGEDNKQNNISDIGHSYTFGTLGIKLQPTEKISLGVLFDEPFGAKASYHGNNNFTNVETSESARAEVHSQNITGLIGYNLNDNLKFYTGLVYQEVKGSAQLSGDAYSIFNGYDIKIEKNDALGWISGISYELPEIALKTSITYRSKINHKLTSHETIGIDKILQKVSSGLNQVDVGITEVNKGLAQLTDIPSSNPQKQYLLAQQDSLMKMRYGLAGQQAQLNALNSLVPNKLTSSTELTTPQSVNFDFQTGLNPKTVLFGNIRWVDWSSLKLGPTMFTTLSKAVYPEDGFDLLYYTKDQWSASLGLGRQLSKKITGSIAFGWDGGAGKPISSLGPTNGYRNIAVGVRYKALENIEISGGVKYFKLGDATSTVGPGTPAGEFNSNSALAYGLKIGYRF